MRLFYIFILAITTFATDRYVSTTGNNAADGGISSPWLTISHACSMAVSSDIIYLRGGTYTGEINIDFVHSGTAPAMITLRNYPEESPIIDGGYSGAIFNMGIENAASNIRFYGLTITKGARAGISTGGNNYLNKNIQIDSCRITDIKISDNTACVYIGNTSDSVLVKNCYLNLGYPDTTRGAGIEVFTGGNNHTFDHNEITGSLKGIYFKHGVNDSPNKIYVRNNYIHDIGVNNIGENAGITIATDNVNVINNLLLNCRNPLSIYVSPSSTCDKVGAFNCVVRHNSIINTTVLNAVTSFAIGKPTGCPERGGRFTTFKNNVVVGSGLVYDIWHSAVPTDTLTVGTHRTVSDSNLFYTEQSGKFGEFEINQTSLAAWISVTKLDSNSTFSNPIFSGNYKLAPTSEGYRSAVDGSDYGADMNDIFTDTIIALDSVTCGDTVTLYATPDAGYIFSHFIHRGSGWSSDTTNDTIKIVPSGTDTIYAVFTASTPEGGNSLMFLGVVGGVALSAWVLFKRRRR